MKKPRDWSHLKTPVMEAWEVNCLGGGDLREYLREARFERGLGRTAIATELTELATKAGHTDFRVSGSTVGIVLDRLGLHALKQYVPASMN